jgi:hypothetical protein
VTSAVSAATTPLPRPRAIDGAVENDISNRTLIVRRPKHIAGYAAFLWRQAHELLALAEERGWPSSGARFVWCSAPGNPDLVHAAPGANLTLRFHFPAGSPAGKVYSELVGKPGLSAIVVVDRETHYFLGVKFRNQGVGD